jgi:serine/threonine-protein kinase
MRDRFARQQRLMARIEHPGIVPVYSLGEVEGLPYVAMRHIDAPTLDELLKREGRLAPKRAAGLIMQVATTLDALHDAGILHRNVKPGSIIVEGSQPVEHAYLTDTGLAHHEGMEMLTPSENFLDNVDYLAPEIALSREVGPPADVYALGCVLFELVTGISPMRRENQMMTMRAHTAEPPPSVLDVSPRLPAELDIVLRKSMAKEPGERYPSPSAFGAAAAAATASS